MDKENILKIIDNFKNKRIGVIGDLMLDQFIWGDVERISPEAPVPVVFVEKESFVPGGAGNTANNIASLGGEAFIVGLVGKDMAGKKLEQKLQKKGINTQGLVKNDRFATIQKMRVIARGQHVVRIDKENHDNLNDEEKSRVLDFISSCIGNWDSLVISDYAKGFITEDLAKEIIKLAKKYNKFIIADAKPKHAFYFRDVSLTTPNLQEAKEITGRGNIEEIGKEIQEKLNCNVLITQGAEGMTLFSGEKIKHFPVKAKEVFDISGAGDTVVAAFSLAQAVGADLETAAIIANQAAGIAVGKLGTATVSWEELKEELADGYE
ncbi:MAG: D-glycero-beta-D-manno-heptose-7-phosphate kinase [Candidatus Pacebacteria bacterium]|nr:D-glycero-beta-D-manno-heptose-7-phosphate kinase [Candidatus Paceibacterota bacterium]